MLIFFLSRNSHAYYRKVIFPVILLSSDEFRIRLAKIRKQSEFEPNSNSNLIEFRPNIRIRPIELEFRSPKLGLLVRIWSDFVKFCQILSNFVEFNTETVKNYIF